MLAMFRFDKWSHHFFLLRAAIYFTDHLKFPGNGIFSWSVASVYEWGGCILVVGGIAERSCSCPNGGLVFGKYVFLWIDLLQSLIIPIYFVCQCAKLSTNISKFIHSASNSTFKLITLCVCLCIVCLCLLPMQFLYPLVYFLIFLIP